MGDLDKKNLRGTKDANALYGTNSIAMPLIHGGTLFEFQ